MEQQQWATRATSTFYSGPLSLLYDRTKTRERVAALGVKISSRSAPLIVFTVEEKEVILEKKVAWLQRFCLIAEAPSFLFFLIARDWVVAG